MPIATAWHSKHQNILVYTFNYHWSWNDLYDQLLIGRKMMSQVNHDVFVIVDLTNSSIIPASSVRRLGDIADTRPQNTAKVFLVGNHYLMRTLYSVFQRIYPNLTDKYLLVSTLDDAIRTIDPIVPIAAHK